MFKQSCLFLLAICSTAFSQPIYLYFKSGTEDKCVVVPFYKNAAGSWVASPFQDSVDSDLPLFLSLTTQFLDEPASEGMVYAVFSLDKPGMVTVLEQNVLFLDLVNALRANSDLYESVQLLLAELEHFVDPSCLKIGVVAWESLLLEGQLASRTRMRDPEDREISQRVEGQDFPASPST